MKLYEMAPVNYDSIPKSTQKKIIDFVTEKYNQVTYNYTKANTCGNGDLRKMYRESADAHKHELDGFIEGLESLGIYIRYNWVGHREEWFFCTLEDVQNKEDFDVDQEALQS